MSRFAGIFMNDYDPFFYFQKKKKKKRLIQDYRNHKYLIFEVDWILNKF